MTKSITTFNNITLAVFLLIIANYFSAFPDTISKELEVVATIPVEAPVIAVEPLVAVNKVELACLRQALFYEARGEGELGMIAVATVILSRKESRHYPDTFCGVIKQKAQFSYVAERKVAGKPLKINKERLSLADYKAYVVANIISKSVLVGSFNKLFSDDVMWYAKHTVDNYWTKKSREVGRVGEHIFYAAN